MRSIRFGLVMDEYEHQALQVLVDNERTTAASVVRKLICQAAQRLRSQGSTQDKNRQVDAAQEAIHVG